VAEPRGLFGFGWLFGGRFGHFEAGDGCNEEERGVLNIPTRQDVIVDAGDRGRVVGQSASIYENCWCFFEWDRCMYFCVTVHKQV
jgi:hypothetical protein